jgi:hypothetical protein
MRKLLLLCFGIASMAHGQINTTTLYQGTGTGNVSQPTAQAISFVGTNGSREIVAAPYTPVNQSGDAGLTGGLTSNYNNGGFDLVVGNGTVGTPMGSESYIVSRGFRMASVGGIASGFPSAYQQWRITPHLQGYYCGGSGSGVFIQDNSLHLEFGGFSGSGPGNCPESWSMLAPNLSRSLNDDGSTTIRALRFSLPCPTTSTATGVTGEIRESVISGIAYHCYAIATNTWVRVAMATW